MPIFNPKLLFETDAAKNSEHKFALYKNYDEYLICDLYEKDHFIAAGYVTDPSVFLNDEGNSSYQEALDIVAEVNKARPESEKPKRRKKTGRIVDDNGNSIAVDENGNEYLLNQSVVR